MNQPERVPTIAKPCSCHSIEVTRAGKITHDHYFCAAHVAAQLAAWDKYSFAPAAEVQQALKIDMQ